MKRFTQVVSSSTLLFPFLMAQAVNEPVKPAHAANPKSPNVLVIMADDMGWSDIGAFGGEVHTPNLDSLANQGVKFTNFHVSPYSAPSRAMFLTGADPHEVGLGNLVELNTKEQTGKPGYLGYFNDRALTLPQRLQDNGYFTVMSGKWHLGHTDSASPDKWGFKHSFAMLNGEANHFKHADVTASPDGKDLYRLDGKLVDIPDNFYSSDYYADYLINTLQQKPANQPFFAYLAFTAPHSPLQAHPDDIAKYQGVYKDGPQALANRRLAKVKALGLVDKAVKPHPLLGVPEWSSLSPDEQQAQSKRMEIYAAMIERMDANIGRVVNALKKTGQLNNTLIVFLSDNGAAGASREGSGKWGGWIGSNRDNSLANMGNKNSYVSTGPAWAQASMSPFAMFKGFTTEGGIRSPLIVAGPKVAQGKISGRYANAKDLASTILAVTKTSAATAADKAPVEGKSLLTQLKKPVAKASGATDIQVLEIRGGKQVRLGDYKALFISDQPMGIKADSLNPRQWQLYNIVKDPGETTNLAAQQPERLRTMIQAYQAYADKVGVVEISPAIK